jgi:hypothetical protein
LEIYFNSIPMKKLLLTLIFIAGGLTLFPQVPEGFIYNAIIKNDSGQPIAEQNVSFRFTISSFRTGDFYSERHNVTTDQIGFVSLTIGDGIEKTGNFEDIPWGIDKFSLKIEIDTTGGTSYILMGVTQFMSVPYALFSKSAGNGFSGNYNDLYNKPLTDGSETKITVGNNLTVTGSGTIIYPYIVDLRMHYIGESFGGGIVFYVFDNGQHGLIAATTDQDTGVPWFNGIKRYTNTTGDGVGAGEMNTVLIITLQTNDNQVGNFAAKVCADYSVTIDGVTYGDWYLPSKHELDILFPKKDLVGGFNCPSYWSSTELSSVSAWSQSFLNGQVYNLSKSASNGVRAIRKF